jgi:hypothetical protein
VGSLERAISARTAGVVRALAWIACIRTSSAERAWCTGQSARRIPQSPNVPDPKNVPLPNTFNHLLFRFALVFGRLKQPSLWEGHRRARASAGDHSLLLSLPLTALQCPFVGHLKSRAVVEAEAERDGLAMQVSLARALIAPPSVWLDPVEKPDPF